MKILNKTMKFVALLLIILVQFIFVPIQKAYAVTPPDRGLGAADSYSVFGKQGVTTTGVTHVWGNAGADSSVGLIQSQVDGSINTGAGVAGVETDARSTYDSLMDASQGTPATPTFDLAGTNTIGPGVYNVGASTLNGVLTLNGAGVYIFRSSSSNTTAHSGRMILTNGACASNVFWAITDAMTIGTGAHVEGTIIAHNELISLATGATLVGRAISLIAQVTLDANQITQPICAAASSALTPAGAPSSPYCEDISEQIVPLSIIESRRIDADSIFLSWGPYSGINTFNVRYGTVQGEWLYNTNVTGFSTTLNNLPANTPIWVEVAARSYCTIGDYGPVKLVGGPGLPNTGFDPNEKGIAWYIPAGILVGISTLLLIQRKYRFLSGH